MKDKMNRENSLQQYFRTDHYRASSRDVDLYQRLRMGALFAMMQESAWRHAESLGFGYSHLDRDGRFWVLSRLTMEIHHLPVWGEEFDLKTWPSGNQGVFALRDMKISSPARELVSIVTAWLVVDRDTRRPMRPRDIISVPEPLTRFRALDETPVRLPELANSMVGRHARVGYTDLDLNGHVNNTRYIDWMQDCFDDRFHQNHRLRRLEVNFLAELRLGEGLDLVRASDENNIWLLEGRAEGGKPVVRGRFHWVPEGS